MLRIGAAMQGELILAGNPADPLGAVPEQMLAAKFSSYDVPVVSVIGNNGIWGLEKHPMEALYGYSVVAELRPGTRYDEVVRALGGHGELVSTPTQLRPALERAFASGLPAVVNVLTDPSVAYPRRSNLA